MSKENLNNNIKTRSQSSFTKDNVLPSELMVVCGVDEKTAKNIAGSVCKWITFGFELIEKGLFNGTIQEYFQKCIDEGWVRKTDGWLNLSWSYTDGKFEHDLGDKFGITASAIGTWKEFMDWANIQDSFIGTLRIVSKTVGKHSLICYKENGNIYISDTSYRGIGVLLSDHIDEKNFIYFTCMDVK